MIPWPGENLVQPRSFLTISMENRSLDVLVYNFAVSIVTRLDQNGDYS